MRTFFLALGIVLITANVCGQGNQYKGPVIGIEMSESPHAVVQTKDGGFVFAGHYGFCNLATNLKYENEHAFVVRTDAAGNKLWIKSYRGDGNTEATDMVMLSDETFVIVGKTTNSKGEQKAYIFKIDANGNLIWENTGNYSGETQFFSLVPSANGGFIAAGYTKDSNAYLTFFNEDGNLVWEKYLENTTYYIDIAPQPLKDGNFLVLTERRSTTDNFREYPYILEVNSDGQILYDKYYNTVLPVFHPREHSIKHRNMEYVSTSIELTTEGDYIIGGYLVAGDTYNQYCGFLLKIHADGSIAFCNMIPSIRLIRSIVVLDDGSIVCAGSDFKDRITMMKCDASGNKKWQKFYKKDKYNHANCLIKTADGGFLLAGQSGYSEGDFYLSTLYYDALLIKTKADGTAEWIKAYQK